MADKKPTHESLQAKIVEAEKAVVAAKEEYKAFCKENPYELPKQPTVHELIKARRKLSPDKPEDHAKANAAAAASAQKAALKQELKSEG
jgi:hypothetical protein